MFDPPVVTVVIPTRNCLPWLPRAIASAGPRADIEIVVFDDGSSDGTAEWLRAAVQADPRILILEGNGIGPSNARNRAIGVARAPLIAFLDADDLWYPGKLEAQLDLHRQFPELAFSFTDYRHITGSGEDRGACFDYWPRFRALVDGRRDPFPLGGGGLAHLFAENVVGTSTVMVRTDLLRALGGFCGKLPSSEDWDLWLRLARRGPVACVPQVMADYLMHRPGNVSAKQRSRVLAMRMIGARHRGAVRAISRAAVHCFSARVLEAEAEIAQARGARLRAAGLRMAAFAHAPSRRAAREVLGGIARLARRPPQAGGYSAAMAEMPAARP